MRERAGCTNKRCCFVSRFTEGVHVIFFDALHHDQNDSRFRNLTFIFSVSLKLRATGFPLGDDGMRNSFCSACRCSSRRRRCSRSAGKSREELLLLLARMAGQESGRFWQRNVTQRRLREGPGNFCRGARLVPEPDVRVLLLAAASHLSARLCTSPTSVSALPLCQRL